MAPVATTEDSRAFLQDRLAVFGKWILLLYVLLGAVIAAAQALLLEVEYPQQFSTGAADLLFLLQPLVLWISMRFGRWPASLLRAIDAGMLAALGTQFALHTTRSEADQFPVAAVVFAAGTFAIARAVVIPSSWLRTLWISVVSVVPAALAAGYVITHAPDASEYERQAGYLDALSWAVFGIIVATVASKIIFGLRREVGRARQLGQYQLVEKIGSGGMGSVYRARHAMLRRPTAIKLLHEASEHNLERFEREVRMTAQLTHPNTVAVFDYGRTPDGIFYYAMELLDGVDLEQLVHQHGPLPPGRVIYVLRQVAGALTEAHSIGLIHRDIKPANIILCDRGGRADVAKVVDFGLVKDLQSGERALTVSADGLVVGTPLYLSPEAICDPSAVDARSDLYALGAVGYFLLTGTSVFGGRTVMEVCANHLHATPERPSQRLGAPLPEDLEEVLLWCLAKEAAERCGSAAELVERLAECVDSDNWGPQEAARWWRSAGSELRTTTPVDDGADEVADTLAVSLAGRIHSDELRGDQPAP